MNGLVFLEYISDAFEEQHAKLETERAKGADPEDVDECRAVNVFWVPPEARWTTPGRRSTRRASIAANLKELGFGDLTAR